MRSASFGRRIIEPSGHELVLIPGQEAPAPPSEPANRDELKEQIRAALMSRIDPSVAGRIPRPTLRAEVGKLVSEIATEQRIQLNEQEEAALAIELTDDMVGLGPLEPLLEEQSGISRPVPPSLMQLDQDPHRLPGRLMVLDSLQREQPAASRGVPGLLKPAPDTGPERAHILVERGRDA